MFNRQKKDCLSRIDKSNKKSIDSDIEPLVNKLNSLKDYYTTSSCSGRILLIEKKTDNKKDARFAFAEHKKADFNAIKDSLKKPLAEGGGGRVGNILKTNNDIWFRQESIILHVCCRNLEAAAKLLKIVRDLGIKRAGIINVNKRLILEIIGTESMETIIARKGNLLVNDEHLRVLVKEANKKLERNKKKINEINKKLSLL